VVLKREHIFDEFKINDSIDPWIIS